MKEPIVIVDTNDVPMGVTDRNAVNYETQIYRVSALWLVNTKGDVLIAQRKLTKKKDPGLWGPSVAGTVEQGETYEQNIEKEVSEEIGLNDITLHAVTKTYVDEPRKYFCKWFTATVDWTGTSNFVIQEEEVEAIAWAPYEELLEDYRNSPAKYIPSFGQSLEVLETIRTGLI